MLNQSEPWHYLIVTAGNAQQATAYESQIRKRLEAGLLREVRDVLVVPDLQGRRMGSGGSTLQCLLEVLRRESLAAPLDDFESAEAILRRLRILIVHAGGDSRRLPAYSACGKIFVPIPGETRSAIAATLFDRLVPSFMALPNSAPGTGQVVVASGDALILFDPAEAGVVHSGIAALGTRTSPGEAARHGVFCPNDDGSVRLYLQKPDIQRQKETGAIGADGKTVLDVGVMSMDASATVQLLRAFCTMRPEPGQGIDWIEESRQIALNHGIDLYREICAALGTDATFDEYLRTVRASGSKLDQTALARLFADLRAIPLQLQLLSHCDFLHFGSTGQLIASGLQLVKYDCGVPPPSGTLALNTEVGYNGRFHAVDSWVEGCRIHAPLLLHGKNVIVGVDVDEPFELPATACLDLTPGFDRDERAIWFIRYYGAGDTFKRSLAKGATFCGKPLAEWMQRAGVSCSDIWDDLSDSELTLWNARVFPAEPEHGDYRRWAWMLNIDAATPEQKRNYLAADRYSSAEIAVRVNQDAFHQRRAMIRSGSN